MKAETARKIETALELSKPIFEPVDGDAALSSNTISHYHKMLSSMLSTAVKWQLIYDNPCLRVDPPKVEHSEAHYLDEVQAAHLLDLLDDEPIVYRTMITLLLHTGLRRGELCGLEWDDINFDLSLLDVQRTSLYLPEKGVFVDETKNNTSRRVLKLTPDAVQLLKRYRMWQNSERLRIGDQWAEEWEQHPRLFTTWDGKPLHPSTVTGWFHTFIERSDLPPISIHSLRHTNATLLIAAGTNVRTVSSHLGHAQTSTTMNIYSHSIKSAEAAAAEALQSVLTRKKKQA